MNKDHRGVELHKVLEKLSSFCACPESRELALSILPAEDYLSTVNILQYTIDANMLTNRFGTPSVGSITDCRGLCRRAQVGARLTTRELLDVAYVLRSMASIDRWRRQIEGSAGSLSGILEMILPLPTLQRDITEAILSEDEIADNASAALADIRRNIRRSSAKAREVLEAMIRSPHYQKFLQESIITQRDGRFVVPVKIECKAEIKGLIHDMSSSGATVFIEPMGVVEANNQVRLLKNEEAVEIDRILFALSGQVGDNAQTIIEGYEALVELDLCLAKSKMADEMRAVAPTLNQEGLLRLRKARHPLLDPASVVPIDVELEKDCHTLVITGPNTGGKTVALKTIGLLQMMVQCGLLPPVGDGSSFSVYRRLLVDIGDEQSIEQSLSTFSAHMTNIVSILRQADHSSLVLLDELGAGTDPVEGAALAVSILERLRGQGASVVATTHYAEIKMYAIKTQGVENASCEFDVATLRPTYRLLVGIPGRSNAFAISQRLGLPQEIIEEAKDFVSKDNTRFEDVVEELEHVRQALEQEREAAAAARSSAEKDRQSAQSLREKLERERERALQQAQVQARRMVEQVTEQANKLMNELEELKKEKDKENFSQMAAAHKVTFNADMKLLRDLADPVLRKDSPGVVHPRPLKKGDSVRLVETNTDGVLESAPDAQGNVTVRMGQVRMKIHQSKVRLMEGKSQNTSATASRSGGRRRSLDSPSPRQATTELDLRGMTVSEALLETDRFLDRCVLMGLETVRLIHGKGTGALRAAITQHLRRHPSVDAYRLGAYGEGESGVTVVTLK